MQFLISSDVKIKEKKTKRCGHIPDICCSKVRLSIFAYNLNRQKVQHSTKRILYVIEQYFEIMVLKSMIMQIKENKNDPGLSTLFL